VFQPLRRSFRRDVPLLGTQHLVTHPKVLLCRGKRQRGVVMGMKMPLWINISVRGALVETHRIGERSFKKIVVTRRDPAEDVAKQIAIDIGQIGHRGKVALAQHQRFERPHCPKWNNYGERVVLADN
jgi:hypothetical protein